jgi:hypothetical protein
MRHIGSTVFCVCARQVRVTTAARRWADSSSSTADLVAGFDQEAAAVLMARHAAFKTDYEDAFDVLRWVSPPPPALPTHVTGRSCVLPANFGVLRCVTSASKLRNRTPRGSESIADDG